MSSRSVSRSIGIAFAAALIVGACSSSSSLTTSTSTPGAQPADTGPVTAPFSAAPETRPTEPPTSASDPTGSAVVTDPSTSTGSPPETTTPDVPPTEPPVGRCKLTRVPVDGAITFVKDGRLIQRAASLPDLCLAEVGGLSIGPQMKWSPSGEAVLVTSDKVLDASGVRDSGYFADNSKVSWSKPLGKALIAPKASDGLLIWRDSKNAGSRKDITFLARTDLAVYHPAGKDIFAVGEDANGVKGLFMASNRGENARSIATLDDPSTSITDLAAGPDGATVYFVHDHGDFSEVHQLTFPSLALADLGQHENEIDDLVVSSGGGVAYRVGGCVADSRIRMVTPSTDVTGSDVPMPELEGKIATPVGVFGAALVITAQDECDGPADVYMYVVGAPALIPVAQAVTGVGVRMPRIKANDLPNDINQQAPG